MRRVQNPLLLSMIGLGTAGGQPRADGSQMEEGIHLRWQIGEGMGFPPGGFDLYRRRQNLDLLVKCGQFLATDTGEIIWDPLTATTPPLVALAPSGEGRIVEGCGQVEAGALFLPGSQSMKIELKQPARHIKLTFDRRTLRTPVATAFWESNSGAVMVATEEAARNQDSDWVIGLFADQIDFVMLRGEDVVICEICVVFVENSDDPGWGDNPIPVRNRIYLPITHPDWISPHQHAPDDQAEAEARLPAALPADQQQKYAEGFATELHDILYDLVGTSPQRFYKIAEQDPNSGTAIDWRGLQLLKLIALDPNLARILGLYGHAEPPDADQYYEYRVVAHYGPTPFPGDRYYYTQLAVGTRYGSILKHEGLTYVSPNPIDIVQAEWDGSQQNALFIGSAIPYAAFSITLPNLSHGVALYVDAQTEVTAKGFLGNREADTRAISSGKKTIVLEDTKGIDTVLLVTNGNLTIFEIELRATTEVMGDIEYISFHHRVETPEPLAAPALDPPRVVATRTGLGADGTLVENQSSVELHWELPEAGGNYLSPGAAVLYHVRRADRGNQEHPDPIITTTLLNENAPALFTETRLEQPSEIDARRANYTDRNVPEGWYTYQVRGIDLFGRLGEWSEPQTIRVFDQLLPPAPQAVSAQYLDPADPWLSQADQDWAAANGPGLKVRWEWPGMLRLQAPDIAPKAAEFRIYSIVGELNALTGNVSEVSVDGAISELGTNMTWEGAQDELLGESIRVGNNFFEVTGNSTGPNCIIQVKNLTAPDLAPAPGPCRIVFSRDRGYWIDYGKRTHWQQRLHAEPAVDIPIVTGQVQSVEEYEEDPRAQVSQPGATRTVIADQPLTDAADVLAPGALLCEGVVYRAYGHTLGSGLKLHIVPQPSPTDSSVMVEPPDGASFVYYPGRRYEVTIPGFSLKIDLAQATAAAHVAISCCDGKSHVEDDPLWEQPGRGDLGGRPGNEGPLSTVCKVIAVKRTLPLAPANVPAAAEPIFARPANYYGQAKYTLAWAAVADSAGYAIYRCSGAALFDRDRKQRQNQKDYYATRAVFADDTGFADWLAQYDPLLTADDLLADPDAHLDAWRAWAKRFYPQLTDANVQALANRQGNEKAFSRVNKDPAAGTIYADTFDGRGQGFYLYRVRAIDAAENLGAWSETYPPMHIYDVTPPAMPAVTSITGGEKHVVIRWRANSERDLKEYRVWRDSEAERLSDVRRAVATAVVPPGGETTLIHVDEGLIGLQTYYYRIAAVDMNGNLSPPTPVFSVRVADSTPPNSPVWERAEWVRLDSSGTEYAFDDPSAQRFRIAVALTWLADELVAETTVERRGQYGRLWVAITTVREPVDASDPSADNARRFTYYDRTAKPALRYSYRIRVKDLSGKINTHAFQEVTVSAVQSA